MDRLELHRNLSHDLVDRMAPEETADQITYHVISTRYAQRRTRFKSRPGKVTKMRAGSLTGFDPGTLGPAAVLLAPFAMALVDHVLDLLLGKAGASVGSRLWAWITRRSLATPPAGSLDLTPERLEEVERLSRSLVAQWNLEPHRADQLIVELVKLLVARTDGPPE
ncbi:hypothetical protein [Streptomyces cinnamoneus]|uniref:Uncharacterized protein n=1 Tax=Streptomyces cinnamoneus TaxID=53446 RepID=A0A918WGQ0_STRCJ|nr:hypothetical protein [Streptomyces cinnamoneus]GHC45021.1 hypothetical protein GCM10010507_20200 [Streptomyces cinnamoneus]